MSAIPHSRQATVAAELDPLDLYNVRSMLSDEERLVQDSVGKFVDEQVMPIIGECFEEERFPRELVPAVAELGLLGSSIHGYGCAGLNAVSYGLICQELERGDSGLRSFVSVQSSLCMYPIYAFGSEEQKQTWLPRMARGEVIGCFGLTEPHGGSDPANMKTRRAPPGQGLGAERREDVDHERLDRRPRDRLGEDRRRHPRLPGREGLQGFHDQRHQAQDEPARVGDFQPVLRQRRRARSRTCCRTSSG